MATYLFAAPSTYQQVAYVLLPDGARLSFQANGDGTFTPPLGRFDSLVRNPDTTWELTLQRSRTKLRFGTDGALTSIADDYGNTQTLTYDGNGRVQRVADSSGSGRYIDVIWGPDGRISTVRDHTARQVQFFYNAQGAMTSVVDAASRTTTYAYWTGRFSPLLSQVTDNWGRVVTTITYDAANRTATYTDRGETYTYTYNNNWGGNTSTTRKTDSTGYYYWVYPYIAGGLITDRPLMPLNSPMTHTDYYADGSIQQVTDIVGVKTYYTYNAQGNVASVTRDYQGLLAVRFDYAYDAVVPEKVTSITPRNPATGQLDPNWQGWAYDYYQPGSAAPSALFHVYRVRNDGVTLDTLTTYIYDTHGRVTRATSATGGATDYAYDASGNLFTVTSPSNNDAGTRPVTTYGYDSVGRVTSVTDALGHATTYGYDNLDRVTSVTLPKPSISSTLVFTTTYSYDNYDSLSGLLFTNVTDPNGILTKQGYDAFGQLNRAVDGLGNTTTYVYTKGLLTSITDANGNVTSYTYDGGHRLIQTTFPDGATETYEYTNDGLVNLRRDRRYVTQHYYYDNLKRLTQKSNGWLVNIDYTYVGQKLTQVADSTVSPAETHTLAYDASFRLSSETQATRGTLTYTYNPDDTVATFTVQGGPTATYAYYPSGALNTIVWSPVTGQVKYAYTLTGQYQTTTFPNGQTRSYTYDDQGRLLQLANAHPTAGNLATYAYGYDYNYTTGAYTRLGQRVSMTATVPSQGLNNHLTKYEYDPAYQLTKATYPNVTPFNGEIDSWTYDAIGNRLTNTVNAVTQTYTYQKITGNPNNWQRLTSDSVNSYTYDGNGNTATKTGYTFGWDAENRIASISGGVTASYKYDYQGRRSSKTVGATSTYLYRNLDLVQETGATPADYLFGPGIDEPIAMSRGGQIYYYGVDALGSVGLVTNSSGVVQDKYLFDAWGATRSQTEAIANPFVYTAREKAEAGSLFYRARYYSPGLGRLLSEDPIDSHYIDQGSRPIARPKDQLYVYAVNNPIKWLDATGLDAAPKGSPCEYYDRKCAETGCPYYCQQAPIYCQNPPINNRVFDNPRILECIRAALQQADQDILRNPPPGCMCDCPGREKCITPGCITQYHQDKFRSCGSRTFFPGYGGTLTPIIPNCKQ